MQITFAIITLIVVWIIFGKFYRKRDGVLPSIVFTIEITLIVWINIPLLVTLPENVSFDSMFVRLPFYLYGLFGWGYTIIANIFLTIVGTAVSSALSETEPHCSKRTINKHFNSFTENATSLKVIGKDLDFLLRKDCSRQKAKILDLKNQVKILCANPYSKGLNMDNKTIELIELYHELATSGNEIRFYDNSVGIRNLLGQIKVDNQKKQVGLFVHKLENSEEQISITNSSKFSYQKQLNGFLLDGVICRFNEAFDNALNPIVKFIALDIGGVYLDGDIDTFFDFLNQQYGIKINKKPTDRLDLSKKLSIGEFSILNYIETSCAKSSKAKFKALSESDKANILREWKSTWKKDIKTYSLIEKIISFGFEVIPFSNVDRDNGEMYIRDNYFPAGCRYHVFSCEKGVSKSNGELFDAFVSTVTQMTNGSSNSNSIVKGYQILLIDDQQENINIAANKGWDTIHFDRNNGQDIEILIKLLKNKAILPQNFELK